MDRPVLALVSLAILALASCRSPQDVIQPVIHTPEDRLAAIKSAPIVVAVEIKAARLVSDKPRTVVKPPDVRGPMSPAILLDLAEVSVKVPLVLRGTTATDVTFYEWVYHFGTHGGPRIFNPTRGSYHIMFLRKEMGYFHTVGDYPTYDIVIPAELFPSFLALWRSGYGQDTDLVQHIVAVILKTYLERVSKQDHFFVNVRELASLTSLRWFDRGSWFEGQIDGLCENTRNPLGRKEACGMRDTEFAQ